MRNHFLKRLEALEGRQRTAVPQGLEAFWALSDEERERMMACFYPTKNQTHHNRK